VETWNVSPYTLQVSDNKALRNMFERWESDLYEQFTSA
jgi:hypothetical protein